MAVLNKSCDRCRHRKVRCLIPSDFPGGGPVVCINCLKRSEECHFSTTQRKLRAWSRDTGRPTESPCRVEIALPSDLPAPPRLRTLPSLTAAPNIPSPDTAPVRMMTSESLGLFPNSCFIDCLLRDPSAEAALYDEFSVLKVHNQRIPSSGLAFFSNNKVDQLVRKIGNARLRDLVNAIDIALRSSLLTRADNELLRLPLRNNKQTRDPVPASEAALFIQEYFSAVHNVFPFLDREAFEQQALDVNLSSLLDESAAFSALYHAVLALGCQRRGGGSFEVGQAKAWKLILVSMSYVADILRLGDSLTALQALTAMSIFAMNACYLQVNHTLLSEATQMALRLRYHKSIISDAVSRDASQRTFWVIYNMEKHDSFQARSASVIADYDIGCPIPDVPESTFGDYNWFLSSIRFSRILSIAYESLFSLTASTKSPHTQLLVAGRVADMLEQWRQSIPKPFQPHQQPLHRSVLADPKTKQVALATHYHYYHLVIAIERVMLFLGSGGAGNCESPKRDASKRKLLNAARTVIELAQFIDVEPCTPIFILGIMPLSALFVLFDFVIHNPHHSSTRSNLTLLDIASGHFSLLEHASGGLLPGGYLSEFAHIAKRYVDDSQKVSAANETRRVDADLDPSGNIQVLQTPLPQPACALETTDIETAPPTVFTAVSEPLNYPIPFNISGSTDMQAMEGVDFWTLFGPSFVDLGQFGQFNQFGE